MHCSWSSDCRYTKGVWTTMQLEFGKADVTINDWNAILSNRDIHGLSKIFKVAWNASILAVLWNAWIERNRRIF
ncbi:hypothetical protein Sjap_016324 [Stephania japonica]|uniref:Uncharacterized protein n=1 Tax=Stephania japonica TaxID=461633 RepID=A0AAP0IMT1_9MAGN